VSVEKSVDRVYLLWNCICLDTVEILLSTEIESEVFAAIDLIDSFNSPTDELPTLIKSPNLRSATIASNASVSCELVTPEDEPVTCNVAFALPTVKDILVLADDVSIFESLDDPPPCAITTLLFHASEESQT